MALVFNLTADQGSSFAAILDLTDASGLPLDISGQSFRAQFRKSYTSSNLTDFICQVLSVDAGQIAISLSAAVTRNIKAGRYVYDVEMYDPNDTSVCTRVIEGQIEFTPAATTPIVGTVPTPYRMSGSGSPEGLVSAPVGYSYVDTDNDILYFKTSGSGPTGWQAFV